MYRNKSLASLRSRKTTARPDREGRTDGTVSDETCSPKFLYDKEVPDLLQTLQDLGKISRWAQLSLTSSVQFSETSGEGSATSPGTYPRVHTTSEFPMQIRSRGCLAEVYIRHGKSHRWCREAVHVRSWVRKGPVVWS